ncbi:MAG: hypothetical protein U0P45_06645 [Acidimicrobiales bacterium]
MTVRRVRWVVGSLTAIGLALRLAWVHWATRKPQGLFLDPTRYLGYAQAIRNGQGMLEGLTGQPTAYYPPGYPWFLGIVAWVTSPITDHIWMSAAVVQAFLGAASIALAAFVAHRLAGAWPAVVAAALYAFYPNLIFHTGVLLGETLYNFLFLAFLAVLLAKPWTVAFTWQRALASGVLLGLAVMVRPISLAVIPVVAVCWLYARKDYGIAARWTGALLLGVVVCILPWTIRNQVRMDAFVPISTNTGDNLCMGHAKGATGAFGALKACNVPYDFLDGIPAEVKGDKAKQRIAFRAMRRDPGREVWLTKQRLYFMWVRDGDHDALFASESYRLDRWMAIPTEARLIWIADRYYWLVTAAGIVGLVALAWRREPDGLMLVGSTLVTAAVPLLFFGDARFKVPVIPLLIICAATLARARRSSAAPQDLQEVGGGADGAGERIGAAG